MNTSPGLNVTQEIIRLIGDEAAELLFKRFGGTSLSFYCRKAEVVDLIGAEKRRALVRYFRGVEVYLPMHSALDRNQRHSAMRKMFDEQVALGVSARKAVFQVAKQFNISDRHVWRVIKQADA